MGNPEKREYVEIPTNRLLGYRGSEKFIRYYTPNLPQTVDGSPILAHGELEWRPRRLSLIDFKETDKLQ